MDETTKRWKAEKAKQVIRAAIEGIDQAEARLRCAQTEEERIDAAKGRAILQDLIASTREVLTELGGSAPNIEDPPPTLSRH